ncbi:hypothetical protein LR48_Vigan03g200400 [Vigna angularis]|uniref:Tf2-1-like SH3-like domain-containing protein n=1 Tax=Phaseolus angularis TaxID=3914 RepID=A0A0L9U7M0_PHAAN|nr:hypothetical protein LR48_Vigan03g200400 [Vigna angularis]
MTHYANRKRMDTKIKEGDWVFLKIRPHRQTSMHTHLHPKLSARYYGPFLVEKQLGPVVFRLQLPTTSRIHPIFHVSQLKLAIGDHSVEGQLPTELQVDNPMYTPLKVLERRNQLQQGEEIPQVLIQWQDDGLDGATWEEEQYIRQQFPDFNLEDKVDLGEEGNVRPLKVYMRRILELRLDLLASGGREASLGESEIPVFIFSYHYRGNINTYTYIFLILLSVCEYYLLLFGSLHKGT